MYIQHALNYFHPRPRSRSVPSCRQSCALSPQSPLTSLKLIKTLNVSLNFSLTPTWGQSSVIPFSPFLTSTLTELGPDFSSSSGLPLCSISSNKSFCLNLPHPQQGSIIHHVPMDRNATMSGSATLSLLWTNFLLPLLGLTENPNTLFFHSKTGKMNSTHLKNSL